MEESHFVRFPTRKLGFPGRVREMLKIIDKTSRQSNSPSARFLRDLQSNIDEHLFCLIECKGVFSPQLSSVQELQLIDMLCTFFADRIPNESSGAGAGRMAFELMFCGREDDHAVHEARTTVLAKTISLAAQLQCANLLTDCANWMQKTCLATSSRSNMATSSVGIPNSVRRICCQIIDDYCSGSGMNASDVLPDHRRSQLQRVVLDLAVLAPNLIPYIIASSVSRFEMFVQPPMNLVEIFTEWICNVPKVVLRPYWEVNKVSSAQGSIPFLRALSTSFCKLLCLCIVHNSAAKSPEHSAALTNLYSVLQLGLLKLMEMTPKSVDAPYAFMSSYAVSETLKVIRKLQQQQSSEQQQQTYVQTSFYALFRALLVAVSRGCFAGTRRDLEQAISPYLSDYPFMEFVLNQI